MNKNNRNQAIELTMEINNNLDTCKGIFDFEFFNGNKETVRVLTINSYLTMDSYECSITTFKHNINNITTYNIYDIKSINCSIL